MSTCATARKSACNTMYIPATERNESTRNSDARKMSRNSTTIAEEMTASEARIQKAMAMPTSIGCGSYLSPLPGVWGLGAPSSAQRPFHGLPAPSEGREYSGR